MKTKNIFRFSRKLPTPHQMICVRRQLSPSEIEREVPEFWFTQREFIGVSKKLNKIVCQCRDDLEFWNTTDQWRGGAE